MSSCRRSEYQVRSRARQGALSSLRFAREKNNNKLQDDELKIQPTEIPCGGENEKIIYRFICNYSLFII